MPDRASAALRIKSESALRRAHPVAKEAQFGMQRRIIHALGGLTGGNLRESTST